MEISVVIPAYNAARTIRECIGSILNQNTTEQFEIVVVDDGSTDGTAELAAGFPEVRVLRQSNAGASAARNYGAREARGWMLLFIDADCVATPLWMRTLTEALRDGADGVKGTLLSRQTEFVARFTQLEYEDRYDRMKGQARINFIDMGSAAYRREVMLAAGGGFDTSYPGASVEDQEFSFRLAKQGRDLRFAEGAKVYHHHPDNLRWYARRKFNIGRWKVLLHTRHPERVISDSHTPQSLKLQVLLVWGMAICLMLAPVNPRLLRACGVMFAAFMATAAPFTLKAARKNPQVAAAAPFMLILRAASLGSGLLYGVATLGASLKHRESQPEQAHSHHEA